MARIVERNLNEHIAQENRAYRAIIQVGMAERKLAKAQTLAQKIEARRELKAARALPVE